MGSNEPVEPNTARTLQYTNIILSALELWMQIKCIYRTFLENVGAIAPTAPPNSVPV